MRTRIIVVEINNKYWFEEAIRESNKILEKTYVPSIEALELFDEVESMKCVCKKFYGEVFNE